MPDSGWPGMIHDRPRVGWDAGSKHAMHGAQVVNCGTGGLPQQQFLGPEIAASSAHCKRSYVLSTVLSMPCNRHSIAQPLID